MTTKEYFSKNQQSFLHSKLTVIGSIIRLCFAFGLVIPAQILEWIQSTILKSVLIDSIFTIEHVWEANAIRNLNKSFTISFVDAYKGRQIHLPPLLLATLEFFSDQLPVHEYWSHVIIIRMFLTFVDLFIAYKLESICINVFYHEETSPREDLLQEKMSPKIYPELAHIFPIRKQQEQQNRMTTDNKSRSDEKNNPLFCRKDIPVLIAHLYYLSPITILSSSAIGCFQNLRFLLLCNAISQQCSFILGNGSIIWTSFWLSLATYVDIHVVVFIIPMMFFLRKQNGGKIYSTALFFSFVMYFACLQILSYLLLGMSLAEFISIAIETHGYSFQLEGLEPSLSTLWYLSMEMFDRFRLYFELLLGGMPYVLITPIIIRLHEYPDVLTAAFWMIGVVFRPPGTLYDLNVGLCLMMLSPRSLARMPRVVSLTSLCSIPVPVCLFLVSYWMWKYPNSGEANFLYFQCLAYNIFVGLLLLMFCTASLRRDKALRVTEKILQNEQSMLQSGN